MTSPGLSARPADLSVTDNHEHLKGGQFIAHAVAAI
jgi:hypothetical protein